MPQLTREVWVSAGDEAPVLLLRFLDANRH